MEFAIQLIIILICLFYGAKKGGIALGLLGGIGLVILVFVFHLQPGKPPVDVMLVIIAVVAASAGSDQLSRNRAQRMLWVLMSAGTQEAERGSQATLKDLDAIAPGGAQQFQDYHNAQRARQGASRPVSVNARDSDDAAIEREILRL